MALFGLRKKKGGATPAAPATPTVNPNTVIYTMPEKFLIPDAPSFWMPWKIWTVVGVVVVGLVGVVIWLVIGLKSPAPQPVVTTTTTPPSSTDTSTTTTDTSSSTDTTATLPTTTTDTSTSSNTTTSTDLTTSTDATASQLGQTDTSSGSTTTTPVSSSLISASDTTILPRSKDTDGDDLTDVEEALYGTNPAKADTDGDGFLDLPEILRGYNPKGPGKLADAHIFETYTNASQHYTLMYPTAWTVAAGDTDGHQITITASPDESFTVTIAPNPNKKSITDWYHDQVPTVDPTALAVESVGTYSGLFTPNRRTFAFIDPSRPDSVFVVTYNVGTKTETNFSTTFEIIIRSIALATAS